MNISEREKLRERVAKRKKKTLEYATSYMSDAKWRKLITSIDSISDLLMGSNWKLVWNEEVIAECDVPNSEDVDHSHLVDGQFYYVAYDDIVWLELITNKPDVVFEYFSNIAKFKLSKTENGIKVHGYEINA